MNIFFKEIFFFYLILRFKGYNFGIFIKGLTHMIKHLGTFFVLTLSLSALDNAYLEMIEQEMNKENVQSVTYTLPKPPLNLVFRKVNYQLPLLLLTLSKRKSQQSTKKSKLLKILKFLPLMK